MTAASPSCISGDGQNLFDPATAYGGQEWRADETADMLIRNGEVEPLILVGIYCPVVLSLVRVDNERKSATRGQVE